MSDNVHLWFTLLDSQPPAIRVLGYLVSLLDVVMPLLSLFVIVTWAIEEWLGPLHFRMQCRSPTPSSPDERMGAGHTRPAETPRVVSFNQPAAKGIRR